MRKLKDVLSLKLVGGQSHQEIATALGISKGSVTKYTGLAASAGLDWGACTKSCAAKASPSCCCGRSTAPTPAPTHNVALSVSPEGTLTMTSREIAELTGKDHKNVMADIRHMLGELGLMYADFSAYIEVPGPNGGFRPSPIFSLPKDLTITLVSGYSVPMRHKIVTRWLELEGQKQQAPAPALPQTYAEALRALADSIRGC